MSRFILSFLVLFLSISYCESAIGEKKHKFIETQIGVYQSSAKNLAVIVSYTEPGIFIAKIPETEIQIFDPEKITTKETSIFISYDLSRDFYNKLHIQDKVFKIKGSLTINLGNIVVAIDNSNPYLTVSDNVNEVILGFKGLEKVVNESGNASLAFLEANQFNEYSDIISPLNLKNGNLYLKNKLVDISAVGLSIQRKEHECINTFNHNYYETKTKRKLKKEDVKLTLDNSIILGNDRGRLIALNLKHGKVYAMEKDQVKKNKCNISYI